VGLNPPPPPPPNQATSLGVCCILRSRFITDWSVENMNLDMTPNKILLDVSVSPKNNVINNKHLILIRVYLVLSCFPPTSIQHYASAFSRVKRS